MTQTTRRTVLATGAASLALLAATGSARSQTFHFDLAADYSEANGGNAVLVEQGGTVLFERAIEGHTLDTPNFLASATKSFWGPAIGAMIMDGLLESYDQSAADILTEWRGDPQKSKITLRHLLTLSSGLHNDIAAIQGEGTAEDKYLYAINSPLDHAPGEGFVYGPVNFYVLGEIMKRRLAPRGQTPLDYLRTRIFEPIGLTYGEWIHDKAGNPHIPNGAFVSARQWVKFGRLLLNKGSHQDRQIIEPGLLADCFRPSRQNPGYGLTWWLNTNGGIPTGGTGNPARGFLYHQGHEDLAGALGAGPNCLYLIHSLDMVIIRQSPAEIRPADRSWEEQTRLAAQRGRFSHNKFLTRLFEGREA